MALKKETFPHKKEGDILGAGHVNSLSDAIYCLSSAMGGSYSFGDGCNTSDLPPFIQLPVVVITEGCDDDDDLFEVQPLYYDKDEEEWKTNEDGNKYCLDPTAFDLTFEVDDRLVAWWDPQRNMFLPLAAGGTKCNFIHFTIISADCINRVAAVLITARECGCTKVPEEDSYEQVQVFDSLGCHLTEDDPDLIGRNGTATFMNVNGYCQWEVDGLCCPPDCV